MDLDPSKPEPCAFCTDATRPTKAWLMPWREATGWWCCSDSLCMQKVKTRTYQTLDTRRLVSVKSLPAWFLNKSFQVRSTSGTIRYMEVMNFPHKFNDNGGGRLRLSINRTPDDIFIDMCTMDRTHKKQVPLRDLYETNPEMIEHGVIELNFPKYVTDARKREWRDALETALQVGRDVFDSMKNHPETLTDSEEDDDVHPDGAAEVILRPSTKHVNGDNGVNGDNSDIKTTDASNAPKSTDASNVTKATKATKSTKSTKATKATKVTDAVEAEVTDAVEAIAAEAIAAEAIAAETTEATAAQTDAEQETQKTKTTDATEPNDADADVKKKSIATAPASHTVNDDVTIPPETESDDIVTVGGGEMVDTEFISDRMKSIKSIEPAAAKFVIPPRSTFVFSEKFDPMEW